jgi:multidrug efflux pump subunit AcrB
VNLPVNAIRRSRVTLLLTFLFVVGGAFSYLTLGQLEDPSFSIKTAVVTARWPGATAEEVQRQVTDVLERNIQQLGQLEHLRSESRPGSSQIWVDIKPEYWSDRLPQVWDELRRKVQQARSDLPPDIIGPFVNDDFGQVYGVILAITGDGFEPREIRDYAESIRNDLLQVPEVARVELLGVQEEQVFVETSASRLATAGFGLETFQALRDQNDTVNAGAVETASERAPVFATGTFRTLDDIRNAQVPTRRGGVVRLGDIADVRRAYREPPQHFMRDAAAEAEESTPCIGLAIAVVPGGNVVTMGQAVNARLRAIEADLPVGINIITVADQSEVVRQSVRGFTVSLGESVAIVFVTLLIGLGLRVGIIVGAQIPLVVLASFIGMAVIGVDLHRISLGALIIALGMLVDNSIVVSDMILTRLRAGMAKLDAAREAFEQAGRPLLIATGVSILGFSPIFFSPESTGEFLGSLFVVVGLALAISWFSGFSITPLNCYLFLKPPAGEQTVTDPYAGRLYRVYRGIVQWCLTHRPLFLGGLLVLLAGAMFAFGFVDRTFFPPATRAQFIAEVELPEGSRIEVTDDRIRAVEDFLLAREEVTSVTSFVGEGIPRFVLTHTPPPAGPTIGQLLVGTHDYRENRPLMADLREFVADHLPDVHLRLAEIALGPSNDYKIAYRIGGPDPAVLRSLSEQVQAIMLRTPGAREVCDNWRQRIPAYTVEVDQERARRAGVSSTNVAMALAGLIEGVQVDVFREGIYQVPITARGRRAGEDVSLRDVLNTPIASSLGTDVTVPLSQVASARLDWVDGRLRRRDRVPSIEVQCNPETEQGFSAEELRLGLDKEIRQQITLPPGYTAEWGSEYEDTRDSQVALFAYVPLAFALMVFLLVVQFNSYRKVLILLVNIPFALIGVAAGLLLFRQPFGFVALLGLLSLVGMLVNIGVVLMDQIGLNLEKGARLFDALADASVMRIRAISLSAGTTVLGMIPLVISDPFWRALGVLIMFGLAVGALITPLLIPTLYSILFRVRSE